MIETMCSTCEQLTIAVNDVTPNEAILWLNSLVGSTINDAVNVVDEIVQFQILPEQKMAVALLNLRERLPEIQQRNDSFDSQAARIRDVLTEATDHINTALRHLTKLGNGCNPGYDWETDRDDLYVAETACNKSLCQGLALVQQCVKDMEGENVT